MLSTLSFQKLKHHRRGKYKQPNISSPRHFQQFWIPLDILLNEPANVMGTLSVKSKRIVIKAFPCG